MLLSSWIPLVFLLFCPSPLHAVLHVWLVGSILYFCCCRPSEDIAPCLGKVALSGERKWQKYLTTVLEPVFFICSNFLNLHSADLRIPLMWKDSEYFKNKGGKATKCTNVDILIEIIQTERKKSMEKAKSLIAWTP